MSLWTPELWVPGRRRGWPRPLEYGYGYPCCCKIECPCSHCSGATPSEVQAVISGLTNDQCSDCADLNGTYSLTQWAAPNCCTWEYTFPASVCGFTGLILTTGFSFPSYWVKLECIHATETLYWQRTFAGDCQWSGYSLTTKYRWPASNARCFNAASSALITAL